MPELDAHTHLRVQTSLLSRTEKAVLQAFARRIPRWINSDHLTLLGLAGMVLAAACYWFANGFPVLLHVASVAIVVNWFGDSMDGTLARFRGRLRPRYGYYVDHILDSVGAALVVGGLVLGGFMSSEPAALFLVAYFLLNIHIYLATSSIGEFKISFGLLGPTELRIGLIVGNAFLVTRPVVHVIGARFLLFDLGATIGAGVLFLILIVASARVVRRLYRLETMP